MESKVARATLELPANKHVILNLGLLGPALSVDTGHMGKRLLAYRKWLPHIMMPGFMAELLIPAEGEPTLVVEGHFNAIVSQSDLVYRMSLAADQDCIAIYDVDDDKGVLYGHNTEAWGSFDVNFFHFPSGDNYVNLFN